MLITYIIPTIFYLNYKTPCKVFFYSDPSERFVVIKASVLCSWKCSVSREVGSVERPLDGQGNSNETCCPPPTSTPTKPITAPATAALNETCYSPLKHIDSPVITEAGVADLAPLTRCLGPTTLVHHATRGNIASCVR